VKDNTMEYEGSCCEEFEQAAGLSRRRFLAGMAGVGAAAVVTSTFGDAFRQTAFGATSGGNVLVVLSLRGGIDGLGMVVPHGDPGYYAARPALAIPADRLVAKDDHFGLHPSMAPLEWLFTNNELAAVHAVGMAVPNRSHFDAMEQIEDADPTSSVRRGWVNRVVGLGGGGEPYEAVQLGNAIAPTSLAGPAPALAAGRLEDISLAGATDGFSARRRRQLATMWDGDTSTLGGAARSALKTVGELAPVVDAAYTPTAGVTYPTEWPATGLSAALEDTAHLIKADVGTEVVTIDYGSWDMHTGYGSPESGDMRTMVNGFARAVDAFMRDLGPLRERVTLVTISEFGRRVAENGSRGLDHGWGNMMLVMGGAVRGGQYYGQWPWLSANSLADGDLAVTTDYRQVLAEVVASRFPARSLTSVFPGFSPGTRLNVMR
jgi:uncharacterized protein (DUF1501 family)